MNVFRATAEEVLDSLGTSRGGLSGPEATRRRLEYGPNAVEGVPKKPVSKRFLESFTNFFAVLLWGAATIAFAAEFSQPGGGMATLGAAIIGVIVVNGVFSFWQEYRAERLLEELARFLPPMVKVVRDGAASIIPSEALVPGDVVTVEQGDLVPADCRLVEAFALRVSNATVTGESVPVSRSAAPSNTSEALQSENAILAGTTVVSGEGLAVVYATGRNTEFGNMAHLTQMGGEKQSPFLKEVAFVTRVIAIFAIGLGATFFFVGLKVGLSAWEASLFGIAIIVANVPEGLLPTITLALAMGAHRMAQRKVLIRHLPAVETLGSATAICTDKTGTLTENRMAVREIYPSRTRVFVSPDALDPPAFEADRWFCEAARFCHTLKRTAEGWIGDPMEAALVAMAERADPDAASAPIIGEIPFDTDRKRMTTNHATPTGPVAYTKGAPETVLPLCTHLAGDRVTEFGDRERQEALRAAEELASRGLRVLVLAFRRFKPEEPLSTDERDLIFLGLVGLEDPPRAGVAAAVEKARGAGIRVIVTTGDHPLTTVSLARSIGLLGPGEEAMVMTGDRLSHLSDAELGVALDAPHAIFARLGADQKLRIVHALKAKGQVVAVTGDGVNDAPAIREADIGIAMGRSGSDVAREAADMVLVDDNFASIVDAIEEGRAVFDNARRFMTYILTSNVPEIVPCLAFALFAIPLPLTIIQILAVDLGTDLVPALGLGAERPHPDVMRRSPRRQGDRLLDRRLLLRAYGFLGIMEAIAAMSAYFFVLTSGGWKWGDQLAWDAPLYLQATTACLTAIVVMQVVNVFLCRDDRASVWNVGRPAHPLLLVGIALEIVLILMIVYTPVGNKIFQTAPLPLEVWGIMLLFAVGMLAAEELRKWIVRRSSA